MSCLSSFKKIKLALLFVGLLFIFIIPTQVLAGCNGDNTTDYCHYTSPLTCGWSTTCTDAINGRVRQGQASDFGMRNECGGDPEEDVGKSFGCATYSRCGNGGNNCVPNPPTCNISGPTTAYINVPWSYTVSSPTGISLNRTSIQWNPNNDSNFIPVQDFNSSPYTGSASITFPSVDSDVNVICNAFNNPAGYTAMQSTGNPICANGACIPYGWYDAGGNSRLKVNVKTDSIVPTINSVTANPLSPSSAATVTFTANVTDTESGTGIVQIWVNQDPNGNAGTWQSLGTCNGNGAQSAYNCVLTWNTNVTPGKHLVRVQAADRSNNTTPLTAVNYYLIDRGMPTFSSLTITPSSPAYSSQPQITSTVSDVSGGTSFASGVERIDIYYNTAGGGAYTGSWVPLGSCVNSVVGTGLSCTVNWPANSLGGTTHYVAINTKDYAGNWRQWGWNASGAYDPPNAMPYGHATYTFLSTYTCN